MNRFLQGTLAALLIGLGLVLSGWGIGEGLQQFRSGDDGSDWDDGSSRSKRLRVVSTFVYALR